MSELDNKQLALKWLEYANSDLKAASIILLHEDAAPRIACFLAQQSAEKTLKAIEYENQDDRVEAAKKVLKTIDEYLAETEL